MPLTPTTPGRSKKLSPAPAASLPTQPAPHLSTDSAPPALEIGGRRFPHSRALPLSALVKRRPAWDRLSGWVQSRCPVVRKALSPSVLVKSSWGFWRSFAGGSVLGSHALKTLTQSVLVKRADLALARCAPASDQRLGVQCWSGIGSGKRVLGFGPAVAGEIRRALLSVLVKSFSGSCNAPLPPFCDPCAGGGLNGWGAFCA